MKLWRYRLDIQKGARSYVHAFLISWAGQEDNVFRLSNQIVEFVDRLTVIYSERDTNHKVGAGEWVKVPNDWFFGKKFAKCIELFSGDIFLQIQADASCSSWHSITESSRQAHKGNVGVWAPDIDFTPWTTDVVKLLDGPTPTTAHVMQTDGIVWSIDKRIITRLSALNFDQNNLGWGIDWAAIAFSYASGLHTLRERALKISHPSGSGYSGAEAQLQMNQFLQQLSSQEREIIFSFQKVINIRRELLKNCLPYHVR